MYARPEQQFIGVTIIIIMKNLAIAFLLAVAAVSALPYNQQVQDQKEQACKQCLIMVEKESMMLVTCNWVVEKDLFKPNLKKGFAYKRLVRKDPFHYVNASSGLLCSVTNTLSNIAYMSVQEVVKVMDARQCEGVQCPGGCCPHEDWVCCPDGLHCAHFEFSCPPVVFV